MRPSFSLNFQAALFDNSPIPTSISSAESFTFIAVNDAWCQLWGFSREEALGKTPAELGMLDTQSMVRLAESFFRSGKLSGLQIAARKKNGAPITVMGFAESVLIGTDLCALKMMVDITSLVESPESAKRGTTEV